MEVNFKDHSDVELINHNANDDYVAMSAWVSFGNDNEERLENRVQVEKLINFLYKNQHMTPFESSSFTFRIKTPVFVAREVFRHRTGKFNEWSGRYSEMLPEFYLPNSERPLTQQGKPGDYYFVAGTKEQYDLVSEQHMLLCHYAWRIYQDQLAIGVAKEVARNVLPLSTFTYFYFTIDARNLMHFLNLRNDSHALHEIREVAVKMEKYFAETMPLTYKAFDRKRNES